MAQTAATASIEGSTSAQAPPAASAPTSTASMPVPMQQTRSQTSSLLKSLETLARDLRYRDMLYYLLDVDRKTSSQSLSSPAISIMAVLCFLVLNLPEHAASYASRCPRHQVLQAVCSLAGLQQSCNYAKIWQRFNEIQSLLNKTAESKPQAEQALSLTGSGEDTREISAFLNHLLQQYGSFLQRIVLSQISETYECLPGSKLDEMAGTKFDVARLTSSGWRIEGNLVYPKKQPLQMMHMKQGQEMNKIMTLIEQAGYLEG